MTKLPKSNNTVYRAHIRQLISEFPNHHTLCFTDGSKCREKTAYVFSIDGQVTSRRIRNSASIYTAELTAILSCPYGQIRSEVGGVRRRNNVRLRRTPRTIHKFRGGIAEFQPRTFVRRVRKRKKMRLAPTPRTEEVALRSVRRRNNFIFRFLSRRNK